jgi:hypothetical protein
MAKRIRLHGIRRNRTYTYEDAAEVLGVSPQTVRGWRSSGLAVMTASRPHLILGEALIAFAKGRRVKGTVTLADDQLYCLSCRAAVRPWGMLADYAPISGKRGRLTALCEHCGKTCNRLVSSGDLDQFSGIFEIAMNCGEDA